MSKPHALSAESTPIPPAGDAELRFRITDYSYAPLSETGAVAYLRAWRSDSQSCPRTIARARSAELAAEAACQLKNELDLRAHMDGGWAIKPAGSVVGADAMVLLYDDNDIISLEKLAPHALTIPCFTRLAAKLAHVVERMHADGLIHRNINPACFFFDIAPAPTEALDFRVRIGGFGLAAAAAPASGNEEGYASLLGGDLRYMSPEHSGRTRRHIDARSDLYSLGVIFYRLLSGHLPFGISGVESDPAEWIHFHIASQAVAPHLLNKTVPEMLSRLVMRLLEKNPGQRYQSAAQLRADLNLCNEALCAAPAPASMAGAFPAMQDGRDDDAAGEAAYCPPPGSSSDSLPDSLRRAILHYHAGEYDEAAACMAVAAEAGSARPPETEFFHALILAASDADAAGQAARLQVLKQHCETICSLGVADAPVFSIQGKILLGEIARLDGKLNAALRCYEQAGNQAEKVLLWHYAGIAHELAARISRDEGFSTSLAAHLKSARAAYMKWGAHELAAQLARRYPESEVLQPPHAGAALSSGTARIRDLESVLRAARALSEEIRLDELIQTIMSVTLEHVGAERGLLIHLDGQVPYIEACARTHAAGIAVDLRHVPATEDDMPMAMLQQALGSGREVYAGPDGTQRTAGSFTAICVPMLKQARVVGALYLENRVLPDAFTVEHTQILQLLAAQAAISLETARLYAALLAENAQRTLAQNALRASQTSLVMGEQFNHIGSMRYLLEEGLMFCSAELCRIYGLEAGKESITYEEFSALLHPDDRKTVLDIVETAVATGGTIRVEHRICRKSGEVRYISGIGKPFYVDGKFTEYVGTATDITSRRQAEDALRVAQADLARVSRATTVGQLTASIAHEINQPLMSIVSNAGASLRWLDRDPALLENARAGLRDIVTEGQRAGDMIQSLQRLTRNTEPVFERVNLNAAIRHILAISRSEIERREVSLTLSLTQENLYVMGDFVQIQQVLLNLVINAIEAMADIRTRPRVLTISSSSLNDGSITVVIEDTGEGIAADATTRIFDAFYTTKKNGMGMGLAICRSIIENHRGRLQAALRQPYGTTLWFDLPLAP
ncbi:ATP-binding protein [Herbaspirillum sp. RV1423]|uniref:ATP-binding protein n=1 Tax=Herbaspirillum sp. RV1423 TaxID=1443993 RepID=UPI0004B7A447|nr:ATP-binding protein [Herbaspirillum sp. RV1423]